MKHRMRTGAVAPTNQVTSYDRVHVMSYNKYEYELISDIIYPTPIITAIGAS